MSEYIFREIRPESKRDMDKLHALLTSDEIRLDKNLDFRLGMFDSNYKLVASGSCFRNTFRCLAVSPEYQGEGLLNQVITELVNYQHSQGNTSSFLYGRYESAPFFESVNFNMIFSTDNQVVLMETRKNGLQQYLEAEVKRTLQMGYSCSPDNGSAAVMVNVGKLTDEHITILEKASAEAPFVHVFILSEDTSELRMPDKLAILSDKTSHLKNIIFHSTGSYIISNAAFPTYFLEDVDLAASYQARLDTMVYNEMVKALGISCRYLRKTPDSGNVMSYYYVLRETLDKYSLKYHECSF